MSVVLGLVFATAAANEIDINDQAAFSQQRTAIAEELAEGKKYAEIEQEDLRRVNTLLARMADIMERSESIASLPAEDQVTLFNHQEEVNQILTNAADMSRLVCRRERKTGTNMPTTSCKTVAQRRLENEGGKDMLRSMQRAQEPPTHR